MSEQDEMMDELEFVIQAGKDGNISIGTLFQVLLRSPVWILLNKEWEEAGETDDVQALVVQGEEGEPLIAMFTRTEYGDSAKENNPEYAYPRRVPAASLLDNLDSRIGVVVNPGMELGIQIHAKGMGELKRYLGQGFLKNIPADTGAPTPKPEG